MSALALGLMGLAWAAGSAAQDAPWRAPLLEDLRRVARIEAEAHGLALGVHVRDLQSGAAVNWGGKRRWYLASMVKVPIAIAVLQAVDEGRVTLDTPLTVRADDYVDGAGRTNRTPVGKALSVRFLLEQMIIHSDNTASDMLIGLAGLSAVNALVQRQVGDGLEPITTLGEVRRQVYGRLTPQAEHLSGASLLSIHRERGDDARLQRVAQITGVPTPQFRQRSLAKAWQDYYAEGLNSGRLDAYGDLLAQLNRGELLSARSTAHLRALMERVVTGPRRLRAGLPADVRLAHKTGTQRERTCDGGVARLPAAGRGAAPAREVLIVACVAGAAPRAQAERAIAQSAAAVCRAGLLHHGAPHASDCLSPPQSASARAAPARDADAAAASGPAAGAADEE
ncbi:serine hydrolase [Xenophilus arseniciresistens]|uniref:beta-lactamase n=1 Tax=Xenophilus arseniciresistens TaxID=1283306 RepID=A0AAE3N9E0_9BURK|nr:serine hydrolase [Xenophilus arseniciresistens]MDA7417028.1 serine hydrolase [Xenophilus arseniciresistens]